MNINLIAKANIKTERRNFNLNLFRVNRRGKTVYLFTPSNAHNQSKSESVVKLTFLLPKALKAAAAAVAGVVNFASCSL